MRPDTFIKSVFFTLVTITVSLSLVMLCITPLLSSPYPKFAQKILNIDLETSSAQEIFSYVRSKIVNRDSANEISNLSQRELVHLDDVSSLFRYFYLVNFGLILGTAFIHWLFKPDGHLWWLGLRFGAFLTLAILFMSALYAFFSWENAFYGFHQIFFSRGSWQFSTSSTLIRNFPPQFWVFSSACVVGMLVVSTFSILFFSHSLRNHAENKKRERPA